VSTQATRPVVVPARLRRTQRWFTWTRAILGGVLAFSALGAVGASVVWKRNQGHTLEPDIVAVLPFRVVGADIDLWREGLVDLLSTALDGTGRLRASDPRAVMNQWHKTFGEDARLPEPDVSVEVAKALQAGLMIQGSVVSTGPGEVRVTADIFNVKWLRKEGSVVADGPEGDMASLVDTLSVDLLKSIWRAEEVPEIRVSSVTTSSVPALRAYLEGEQHFRRSEFVPARDAFTRAVEIDSTFAIAAHRLSIAYGWSAGAYAQEHLRYAALAARHLSGLPVRDSLLILGHKLVDFDGDLDVIPIYQRLTSSYPDDFEAWDGEGEAYWHLGPQAGYGPSDVVDALARGYAVDSTMAPSLIHLVQSANAVGDPELVRTWTARYLALDSTSEQAEAFRLAAALRFGSAADSSAASAALDTASQRVLGGMGGGFAFSGVTGLGYFETVYGAASAARFPDRSRSNAHYGLGDQYLRHGQLARWHDQARQAAAIRGSQGDLYTLAMARLAGVAQDSASSAEFERLAGRARYPVEATYLAFLYAKDGLAAEARRGIERFDHVADSLQARADTAEAGAYRGMGLAVRGQLAAAQDSGDVAMEQLRRGLSLMPAWTNMRDFARYLLATLQESRGGGSEALRTYESLFWTPSLEAVGYLKGAQLHERRGEVEEALEDYERFLALWGDADPELQPRVQQAREAVERLKSATDQ
jgi:tetratricopeptide (TPR) repeat protein